MVISGSPLLFEDDMVLLASLNGDLQLLLERLAAERKAPGMRINTSKSETMVLSQKRVGCLPQVGSLPQVEEFNYVRILFTGEGRTEQEIDRRLSAASAIMWSLYWSVVVKRELSQKARLSVYRLIFVPSLNYGHKLWVLTERMRSWTQASEMSFHCRVAGLALRNWVRSLVIWEGLPNDQSVDVSAHLEEPFEVVWASGEDGPWTPS